METDEIRKTIKSCIANVTSISPDAISDEASYVDDLALDSLSILETVVEVEYRFKIKVPEEELSAIKTVADTVLTVQKYLCAQAA